MHLGRGLVVSTAAFHARVRLPVSAVWKKQKLFLPHPRVKLSIVGSLRDQDVAFSASDRRGSNFESCVWRTVSSHSSHHLQVVFLPQFSLYVHKGGLKPDSFHFICHMHFIIQRDLDVPSSSVPKKYDGTSNMAEFRISSPTPSKLCWNRGYIYLIHTVMLLY